MAMFNPPHPGEIIADILEDQNIGIRELARALDVAPSTVQRLVSGNATISPEMAVRLAAVLGGTPSSWIRSRRHGALKKRKEKLTYLISQQNTARQKFRLMLNHRAVILAASESGGYQVPNSALFSASRISSIFRTPRLLYRKLSTCLSEYGDLSMNHFPYCSVLSM